MYPAEITHQSKRWLRMMLTQSYFLLCSCFISLHNSAITHHRHECHRMSLDVYQTNTKRIIFLCFSIDFLFYLCYGAKAKHNYSLQLPSANSLPTSSTDTWIHNLLTDTRIGESPECYHIIPPCIIMLSLCFYSLSIDYYYNYN